MARSNKTRKTFAQFIEADLIVVLAIILILGVLFGYSLAKGALPAPKTSPTSITTLMDENLGTDDYLK